MLGNHDFYGGSIAGVGEKVASLCRRVENLSWLDRAGVVQLTPRVGLVGCGGWADGRYGDWHGSTVELNDYYVIEELANLSKAGRRKMLEVLPWPRRPRMRHFPSVWPMRFPSEAMVLSPWGVHMES